MNMMNLRDAELNATWIRFLPFSLLINEPWKLAISCRQGSAAAAFLPSVVQRGIVPAFIDSADHLIDPVAFLLLLYLLFCFRDFFQCHRPPALTMKELLFPGIKPVEFRENIILFKAVKSLKLVYAYSFLLF